MIKDISFSPSNFLSHKNHEVHVVDKSITIFIKTIVKSLRKIFDKYILNFCNGAWHNSWLREMVIKIVAFILSNTY